MSENSKEEISIQQILLIFIGWIGFFRKKWKLILLFAIIGSGIGFVSAFLDKPVYTAELTLALEEKSAGGGAYAGLASQLGLDLGGSGGGAFNGENNIELLKSRYIIETALLSPVTILGKKQLLINRYIEFNEFPEKWEKIDYLKGVTFTENEPREQFGITKDSILNVVYKDIKKNSLSVSKIDKKLSIIAVDVKSKDELFAKSFAEVLVYTSSNFYIQTKTKKAKSNLDILEARLDSVKRELDKEIHGAAINKDNNMNVIRAEGNVKSTKKQLNVQVLTTMYGELIKNTELAKYTLMREEPLIQIIDRPILPLDKQKKSKLMGIIGGGFAGSFAAILFLLIKRFKSRLKTWLGNNPSNT